MPLQSFSRPGDGDLSDVASSCRRLFLFSTSYRFRVTLEMCRRQVGGAAESPDHNTRPSTETAPVSTKRWLQFGRGIAWPFGIKGLASPLPWQRDQTQRSAITPIDLSTDLIVVVMMGLSLGWKGLLRSQRHSLSHPSRRSIDRKGEFGWTVIKCN